MLACSVEAVRLSRELGGDHHTKPVVVVAVVGVVVVAVRTAAIVSVVEIATAAQHAIVAFAAIHPIDENYTSTGI